MFKDLCNHCVVILVTIFTLRLSFRIVANNILIFFFSENKAFYFI